VEGDAVVIAAGSWSADMALGGARVPVRPIRGQLLQLRLARPAISRVVWGERCYVVPWLDGSLLVGATVEDVGFDERPTAAGVRVLLDAATELVPEVAAAAFEEVRVGLRPATSDELPVIGASSTMRRVFYATGHYRNGVLLAPLTALAIADLVLEGRERPEVAAARPDRFGL
jgi:glycine/D-amino acid oxidase-like deaminating enzyme